MGRTAETKKKILAMLKKNNRRLMDIYPELGLSAATVSQHLKELKEMGLIEELDNSHFKNEKYYSLRKVEAPEELNIDKQWKRELIKVGAVGIMAIIGFLGIFILAFGMHGVSGRYVTVNVLLTDPPHVPLGTESLYINYTSIRLHVANTTKWISVNASGRIDLMSLINVSKIIGLASIPEGTNIDKISFTIQNGYINIDNKTYGLYMGSNQITGSITGLKKINSTEDILVDFSPAVLALYNNNSVSFEMIPSLSAEVINGRQLIPHKYGNGDMFAFSNNAEYNLSALRNGLDITSAKIESEGNLTRIVVIVKDISNRSINVSHIEVFGQEPVYLNSKVLNSMSDGGIVSRLGQKNSFINSYNWTSGNINSSWFVYPGRREYGNENGIAWVTIGGFFNMPRIINSDSGKFSSEAVLINQAYNVSYMKDRLGVVDFIIDKNETLTEPFSPLFQGGSFGYVINPGQSATFEFNGTVTMGKAGLMIVNFTPGEIYRIGIIGSNCGYAGNVVIAG